VIDGANRTDSSRLDPVTAGQAETAQGLDKAELVYWEGLWKGVDDLQLAMLGWLDHTRLRSAPSNRTPAEVEAEYYRHNHPAERPLAGQPRPSSKPEAVHSESIELRLSMRAIVYSQTGGPDVLRLVERAIPAPAIGQVRVRVHISGVNPTDWKSRRGSSFATDRSQADVTAHVGAVMLAFGLRSRHADGRAAGLTWFAARQRVDGFRRTHQTGATLLTLTKHAQTAVRTLTQDPQAPENAGLRITPGNEGLELMRVAEPVPGDALIDEGGAWVFVEPQAAQLLDEQTLDAQVEDGNVNFFLASPDAMSSPDALDDETQARHDASRADPLPE
jgi:Fe-S cluster assembly iron-binding protein IscA